MEVTRLCILGSFSMLDSATVNTMHTVTDAWRWKERKEHTSLVSPRDCSHRRTRASFSVREQVLKNVGSTVSGYLHLSESATTTASCLGTFTSSSPALMGSVAFRPRSDDPAPLLASCEERNICDTGTNILKKKFLGYRKHDWAYICADRRTYGLCTF